MVNESELMFKLRDLSKSQIRLTDSNQKVNGWNYDFLVRNPYEHNSHRRTVNT